VPKPTLGEVRQALRDAGVSAEFLVALDPLRPKDGNLSVQVCRPARGPALREPLLTWAGTAQDLLDQNAVLLWQLVAAQRDRLTRSRSEPISSFEKSLASLLRERLMVAVGALPPGKVVSRRAVEIALPRMQPFEAVFLGTMIAPPQRPPPATAAPAQNPAQPARMSSAMVAAAAATGRPVVPAAPGQVRAPAPPPPPTPLSSPSADGPPRRGGGDPDPRPLPPSSLSRRSRR
jgi:hypothetical protein